MTTIDEIEVHLLAPGAFVAAATIEGRVPEDVLVRRHRPLLNLDKNPEALPELRALRAQCVEMARSPLSPAPVLEKLDHSTASSTLLEQALHLDAVSRRELIRALEDSLEQPFASGQVL